MKIVFTGSHGTGKSTLVNELLKVYNDHIGPSNFRREMSLELPLFNIYKQADIISQGFITGYMAYQAISNNKFIQDRCIIDTFAYTDYADILDEYKEKLFQTYKDIVFKYDYIFYIPVEFDIIEDGFRETEKEYQKQIDQKIKYYLDIIGVKYYTLSGSVEQRLYEINKIIQKEI